MPSPFPGMDPYLEEPTRWPGVHQRLITYAADVLQVALRPRYQVLIGERVYIAEPPQSFYPDVTLVQYPSPRQREGSVAVAAPDVPTAIGTYLEETQRQPFIEIVHVSSAAVVTAIEILSPSNKVGSGRAEYLRQQQHILASGTHLVEIDLLRVGEHTVGCPKDRLPEPYHFLICVNRARHGWAAYCMPLPHRLPRVGMPLRAADPDVVLDVQSLFDHCYDSGGYADFIDYHQAPVPPLQGSDAAWAVLWLQQQGKC